MDKLLLIDGNSLLYRAYYGTAYGPRGILTNADGLPVNAILTFTKMIWKALETYQPTHILVAFDAGKKTMRHDKLPSYKEGRKKMPEELFVQIEKVKKALTLMDIKQYELKGIEADDIIGSLAAKFSEEKEVLILSSDKDMYQLVNPKTKIIAPQNGKLPDKIIDFKNFEKELGYMPAQVTDIKGLAGDASDNLKGVEGIGPKGAIKLIKQFGSLEDIYQSIDQITEKQRQKLLENKTSAFLCKELATIIKTIDVPFTIKQLKYTTKITSDLIAFYQRLGISSIVKILTLKLKKIEDENQTTFSNLVL